MAKTPKANNVATLPLAQTPANKRTRRPQIKDWAPIERVYRAGVLTVEQMAAAFNVERTSIIHKAKRAGWTRSLKPKISREVEDQLTNHALIEQRKAGITANVTEVTAVANLTVDVILRHRSGIRDLQQVANGQLAELRAVTIGEHELQTVMRLAHDTGAIGQDELKEALKTVSKLCALPSRMGALSQLSGIYERLQTMERQAFGIKGDENPEDDEDDVKGLLVEFVEAPYRELE